MAVVKIIRACYKEPASGYTNAQGQFVPKLSSNKLAYGDWYLESDIALAEASMTTRLFSIRGVVDEGEELAEFIGWEEKDLDTGD